MLLTDVVAKYIFILQIIRETVCFRFKILDWFNAIIVLIVYDRVIKGFR